MGATPNKGPIRFFEKHVTKYDKNINLEMTPILSSNIDKWIANEKIDNELLAKFWTNKNISNFLIWKPSHQSHVPYVTL